MRGLRVAHQEPLPPPEEPLGLTFDYQGRKLTIRCKVVRTTVHRTASASTKALMHSGLEIVEASREANDTLRHVVEEHVLRALDEQRANARGLPAIAAQSFQTGKAGQFVRHEWIGGKWRETPTTESRQPLTGFTVSTEQTPQEILMLREAFEAGDAAARDMLRKMAEMSISKAEGIPTRRYTP